MAVDPKMFDNDNDVPVQAAIFSQATSNQAVRAAIALVLVVVVAYQLLTTSDVSDPLLALLSLMLGYYFGVDVPTSK